MCVKIIIFVKKFLTNTKYKMILKTLANFSRYKNSMCMSYRGMIAQTRLFSQILKNKYTDLQKEKILQVMNESDTDALSGYDLTKGRIKKLSQWKTSNGQIKTISDLEMVDGFSEKTAEKLFDSIVDTSQKKSVNVTKKIKGQILQPRLNDNIRQDCKTVLSLHIAVNSISWILIDRANYEVTEWTYHGIEYPDGKKLQIIDILDIAWSVTQKLPTADIYVMKAEATTLRAGGSDPNNPKVIAVNLQKAQMVAMIVALINARSFNESLSAPDEDKQSQFCQKVYFLRPTLPYRLYGTLVGNEKVSTDQTVEMLLANINGRSTNKSHVYMTEEFKTMFRSKKDLQKDMLGHCLFLGLTFMDLCIYRNQDSINKLLKRGE